MSGNPDLPGTPVAITPAKSPHTEQDLSLSPARSEDDSKDGVTRTSLESNMSNSQDLETRRAPRKKGHRLRRGAVADELNFDQTVPPPPPLSPFSFPLQQTGR